MTSEDIDYTVYSNQYAPHPDLWRSFQRHRQHYQRPISLRTETHWEACREQILTHPRPVIIDSGCGKGYASVQLAQRYPDHWILALDQSRHRLDWLLRAKPSNIIVLPGNCVDYWRLISESELTIARHYLLYPNPWPKKKHLYRRWHAHPIAADLLKLAPHTIVRSNWLLYLKEARLVCSWLGLCSRLRQLPFDRQGLSHFEHKYLQARCRVYELSITNV